MFVLLAVILLASATASWLQSSLGAVSVRSIVLPTQNGQWVAADLFRPRTATAEQPAPLVVVVPGFQRTKETLSNISIELSRRGVVVIAIDPYAQGSSSASMSRRSATEEGYGLFAVVDYVHDTPNLNYVDRSRIGATGHSAGGNAAIRAASHFGELAGDGPSKLHSVYVSGYALTMTRSVLRHVRSNVGMSYALHDEGAYRNELAHGDMRRAPEALRLVRSAGTAETASLEEVGIGRLYGDAQDRTLRVVHNEPLLHPLQPYSFEATAHQLDYFTQVFGLDGAIPGDDQIWQWKELGTLLALLAALCSLVPLARLYLRIPWFQELVHEVPPPQPRPVGRGLLWFWGVFVLSALVACVSYIPLCELSQELFAESANREQTWFFPQRMNNGVMLWALLNGCFGFLLFFGVHLLHGRRQGASAARWGASVGVVELLKTVVLALLVTASCFGLLFAVHYLFHVDYRFVFLGVRAFPASLLPLLPMYAPVFLVFFLSNSLRVNGAMRFEGAGWGNLLLIALANTLGLALIVAVQYSVFAATGTVYWTDGWLYVNLLFGVVPVMFALPILNRLFFRLTGRIYLGALTTCCTFVMILLTNTVCYLPFA